MRHGGFRKNRRNAQPRGTTRKYRQKRPRGVSPFVVEQVELE
jgi:hypothetical protein